MKKHTSLLYIILFLYSFSSYTQTNIKTMFYNLLNYDNNSIGIQKTPHLKTIIESQQPDLFMVCELKTADASDYLFDNALLPVNSSYKKATFKSSQSPATGLQQMVYFNAQKLSLENENVIETNTRDINHYTFKTNTENSTFIEVFVTHLKASTGNENREKRLAAISIFKNTLEELPEDSYVLFAGDFNFYTSNEEGYLSLTNSENNINIVDPINKPCPEFPNDGVDYFDFDNYNNTYFWNNASFKDIHTQSTRTSNTSLIDDSGATGGMDDRFDFILFSENFQTSADLHYIEESYKAVGNNGDCYNSSVNNSNCTGAYSQNLREALIEFSDHLPVVMEIQLNENTILSSDTIINNHNITIKDDTITINSSDTNIKNIFIYNQVGQLVLERPLMTNKKNTINIKQLPKGFYFLTTNTGISKKLIKK